MKEFQLKLYTRTKKVLSRNIWNTSTRMYSPGENLIPLKQGVQRGGFREHREHHLPHHQFQINALSSGSLLRDIKDGNREENHSPDRNNKVQISCKSHMRPPYHLK